MTPGSLTPEKAFDKAVQMSQHLRKPEHQNSEQGQGVLNLWLAHCQIHRAPYALEAFEYFLSSNLHTDRAARSGTPMVDLCALRKIVIQEMQEGNASATKEAVPRTPPYPEAPPSASELANLSSWDRAYEQALAVWMKERPDLPRTEAREAFENDDEYITRVQKFFSGP